MKAIYINAPGEVEIRETEMPRRRPGEALLKLLYGGICGSDLGSYRGTFAYFNYPRIPGHEFSAEIVEIDENPEGLKKGDVVTCNPYFNCGRCYSCRRGLVNACMDNQTMGCQRDGAFREYITMPVERIYSGKGVSARNLAIIEPFCIGYHGAQLAQIRPGDKVLVMGTGTIGVLSASSAKAMGAEVYVCDISPFKLQYAQEHFGFDGTILNDKPGALEKTAAEITGVTDVGGVPQINGFDVCIEAVGLPETFQNCIDMAAFGGRVVLIGVSKKSLEFNFTQLQKKELHVSGSRNALKKDFLELIDLTRDGIIHPESAVTHTFPFTQAPEAFREFDENNGRMLKVLLDFT